MTWWVWQDLSLDGQFCLHEHLMCTHLSFTKPNGNVANMHCFLFKVGQLLLIIFSYNVGDELICQTSSWTAYICIHTIVLNCSDKDNVSSIAAKIGLPTFWTVSSTYHSPEVIGFSTRFRFINKMLLMMGIPISILVRSKRGTNFCHSPLDVKWFLISDLDLECGAIFETPTWSSHSLYT